MNEIGAFNSLYNIVIVMLLFTQLISKNAVRLEYLTASNMALDAILAMFENDIASQK